jgi:hypothetical protein
MLAVKKMWRGVAGDGSETMVAHRRNITLPQRDRRPAKTGPWGPLSRCLARGPTRLLSVSVVPLPYTERERSPHEINCWHSPQVWCCLQYKTLVNANKTSIRKGEKSHNNICQLFFVAPANKMDRGTPKRQGSVVGGIPVGREQSVSPFSWEEKDQIITNAIQVSSSLWFRQLNWGECHSFVSHIR